MGGQLIAAALSGAPLPNPVVPLFAADVTQGGAAVPVLAAPAAIVRIDLLSAASAPRAVLLRNSAPVARFWGSSVAVPVAAGDLLEVDATAYRRPLTFQVVAAEGLAAPSPGTRVTTHGDILSIGRVRLQAP